MFGFAGDPNERHNVASLPLLPLPIAALAGFGIVRLWRMRRDPSHSLILLALPVFLVAPLVATEGGSPHALRALGLAAPVGVTIGLGVVELVERVRGRWGRAAGGLTVAAVAVTLTVVAVWSGLAYLGRPAADRYGSFRFAAASMADLAAEHPGSAVILDGYSSIGVQFIDFDRPPAIIAPGTKLSNPSAYTEILALSRDDLTKALGPELGGRAVAVAWDPSGAPAVWAVVP
jgi:hypothetical protein